MIRQSHQGFAETLLFILNIFLIFLLVFGGYIVVPQWLQPVGRMHPLLLHFPIVLLTMAILFEYFRFRPAFKEEALYQNFTTVLLLGGSLLAALTAVMGFFLAKEPGYSGNILQWHKWTGASVVWLSSAIYWFRDKEWYRTSLARAMSALTFIAVILAGHYGADLTHGENFILAPIRTAAAPVPIDQALVYQDVIQPIFNAKCISCHNEDKVKGKLMLTDSLAVLKGGKSGKLFVSGDAKMSLLLQRVYLPMEDDKRMPPSGKPQLTDDELTLLYLWVKSKPKFKQKVVDLPASDSLRTFASKVLSPASSGEAYDFSAADDKTIAELNNNYRIVRTLAKESPALSVNIYNKRIYTPKVLDELSSIKKQVVSLNLNKMPVKDAELKTIAGFENLRSLSLNFTDIDGSGLKELKGLKYLKVLSLAGTKIKAEHLKQIIGIKSLTEVVVWNTGIKPDDIKQLRKLNSKINFVEGFQDDGKPIRLTMPLVKSKDYVYTKPFELLISHPINGAVIRYTMDGTDPDSTKSPIYKPGIIIDKDVTVKVRAYKDGWYGSDIVMLNYDKGTYTPDSSYIDNNGGGKMLIDKELGSFEPYDRKWVGVPFEMVVHLVFNTPVSLKTIGLGCLRLNGQQILFPGEVEILGGMDKRKLTVIGRIKPPKPLKDDPDKRSVFTGTLSTDQPLRYFEVRVKPVKPQSWFPPQKPANVWVDEIFFN
ncbi:MAG: c-type cytochrome domain-containing protein [Bacteroidota bacterium]